MTRFEREVTNILIKWFDEEGIYENTETIIERVTFYSNHYNSIEDVYMIAALVIENPRNNRLTFSEVRNLANFYFNYFD